MPLKTYQRWKSLGFPESIRRERRERKGRASLEHTQNEVRSDEEAASPGHDVVRVIGCGCGRHWCPRCGRRLGYRVRQNIVERLAVLQREHGCEGDVQMWSLTGDPKQHASPAAMWEHVCRNRLISRTMQSAACSHYVAVIEWHESGWPHWHVLVWKPVKRIFINKRELEDAWGLGICRFTPRNGRPMAWAINYVTKYITKPDGEVPAWVMQRAHVRAVWASRPWGPVCRVHVACSSQDESTDGVGAADLREVRSNAEAIATCSSNCALLIEHITEEGEMRRKWLGTMGLHVRVMRRLISRLTGHQVRSMAMGIDSAAWRRLQAVVPLLR